jgi:uncharacterized protein YjbI with pentapeptide repeats
MANQEHLDILAKGVEVWNEWRKERRDVRPDLDRATLIDVDLRGADLSKATLYRVDLSGAKLSVADLTDSNLASASFRRADLGQVNFTGADMHLADLTGAWLFSANPVEVVLSNARLKDVTLESAIVGDTLFGNVDVARHA